MVFEQKKAQVAIFAIIAVVIVSSVAAYFLIRPEISAVPQEFKEVEDYFVGCAKLGLEEGARILGEHGGYITLPEFQPGSDYMPFSSQLDFFGNAIPYWFYVSGNNLNKEQVPSKTSMEKQLADFVETELESCDFSELEKQGYEITKGNGKASVEIADNGIDATIDMPLTINRAGSTGRISTHKVQIQSKLGKFYNTARKIYEKQQEETFLENYSLDIISLYAPYTDVELSCAPKVWVKEEVENEVKLALQENIASVKLEGNYYRLANQEDNYFVVKGSSKISENVNFIYSDSFPTRFEVTPEENGLLMAKPTGAIDSGLGILGFCFVQYHFVYDLAYPVLIQVFDEQELFQFPVVVLISKNRAREPFKVQAPETGETDLCKYRVTDVKVVTEDTSLKPIESGISFRCFTEKCDIGKTRIIDDTAQLTAKFPQCINGFIKASAKGYADGEIQIDTNEPAFATVVLQPLYNLSLEVFLGGAPISKDEQVLINFETENDGKTIAYPQQKSVELKEGFYNITVQAYRQGSLTIGAYKSQQCVNVPASGIKGLLGFEDEKCYDIDLPSQTITQIVTGGGNTEDFFTEDMLKSAKKLKITASVLPTPTNILDLQQTFILLESSPLDVSLS